jgi:benzoyl-CoA-dihydrodiol lyase
METTASSPSPPIDFDRHPAQYLHWKLAVDGPVATLAMDVQEDAGLRPDYRLKLNSYDLGVDIELADAVQRIRFEHPGVRVVVITSLKERVFCAGANIFMLRGASHAWKVNFCKYTNETRIAIEEAGARSGLTFIAALNGICAGGGYELALACDEIHLVDDGNSAVSLPETPLLGVLPGTGGLTRLVDKRKVRRDLADVFATVAEGVRGRRAVEWRLVDAVHPTSQFKARVEARARELAASRATTPGTETGITLAPLTRSGDASSLVYSAVRLDIDRSRRVATITVTGPDPEQPSTPADIASAGDRFWPLRAFRELDDVLLRLRFNEPLIGTIIVRTTGDPAAILALDETMLAHRDHWLVREIILLVRRTLKRMDLTARSFFALIEPGSCFAGTLFELALAADRSYMLDDPERPSTVALSGMNAGPLIMSNGLTRLETRFLATPDVAGELIGRQAPFDAAEAVEAGLVSFAPDDLDWEDEVRLAIESRAALSPDALTAMEANLRFAGPETMETKIFGRLSAWQNWIFNRPNAVGELGALTAYGTQSRPQFDYRRT